MTGSGGRRDIELRVLTMDDVEAHNAGEDVEVVKWLSGVPSTSVSTRRHFAMLARNAARRSGKRGFGVWWDGRLAGYIDFDPGLADLPSPGDVNIAYSVHPWARGCGIASESVRLICAYLAAENIGQRAVIRAERANPASLRVAERSGFRYLEDRASTTDFSDEGIAIVYATYGRKLLMTA